MNTKAVIVIKDDAGAYLAHHGVEGQRWGHKNGPPYPLDSSMSTGKSLKEEARAKKKELKEGKEQAKKYQKELNNADKIQSASAARFYSEKREIENRNLKIAKKTLQGKDISKYAEQNKISEKRLRAFAEDYAKGQKKVEEILKEMGDKYVYDIYRTERSMSADRFINKSIYKDENLKLLKGIFYTGGTYYQSAKGNAYKVRLKNEKNSKKFHYTTQNSHVPTHTEYYYYYV